jgi:acetate---CoA ligase (ADP-forming)
VLKSTTLEDTRIRAENARALDALFAPAGVAVIGATDRSGSVGRAVFENLQCGYTGHLLPVNPNRETVFGVPCVADPSQTEKPVELAVIAVPAAAVPDAVIASARAGCRAAVVLTAGFKEVGGDGVEREKELARLAREHDISVLGPNCLGVMNTALDVQLNASFASAAPQPGKIAFMSQSGALCTSILDYAREQRIGFSKFISFGNKADIDEVDLLHYLAEDEQTSVVLMYLEDLDDGQRFIHLARRMTGRAGGKPILAIKTGRTAEGAAASASHTGALAGTDEVYEAILAQAGVLRVDTVQELFELASAFGTQPMPAGNRVAIVTNAGGPGIMTTDACVRQNLSLARLSEETRDTMSKALPDNASLRNPVDVIGDARSDRYQVALDGVLADEGVDAALVVLTPQNMTDVEQVAHVVADASSRWPDKPVLASFMGGTDVAPGVRVLRDMGIPHYSFPENAARALAAMTRYRRWVDRPETEERIYDVDRGRAHTVISAALAEGRASLLEPEAIELLTAYGLPVPKTGLAASAAEVERVCAEVGLPVAMKVASPDVLHKTDVGGVELNLATIDEALAAFERLTARVHEHVPGADLRGVTVQAMAPKGREVILGAVRDPRFGPLVMFGLGGIYAEALKDVAFRLAPLRPLSAERMLDEIRGSAILGQFRGAPAVDRAALSECLQRLSQLMVEFPVIAELDMNPIILHDDGVLAVDARVVLTQPVAE